MPIMTFSIPGGEWRTAKPTVGPFVLQLGEFVGALFVLMISRSS